jgi:hypothetical protein
MIRFMDSSLNAHAFLSAAKDISSNEVGTDPTLSTGSTVSNVRAEMEGSRQDAKWGRCKSLRRHAPYTSRGPK